MLPKLPAHLAQDQPTGIQTKEPIAQFEIGSGRNFVYLILDWISKQAVLVDPQADLSEPLAAMTRFGFSLAGVYLTHTHYDHIAGVPELLQRFPEIPVYVHALDQHRLKEPDKSKPIEDQDLLMVGTLGVRVLHTPGHSPGECCYFLESLNPPYLLTGDTVFIRDCGRTDLTGGSDPDMFASLSRIKSLPKQTILLPGHHYQRECASTLAQELLDSPPFQCQSVEELAVLT